MQLPSKVSRIHWWALAQTAGPILLLCIVAIWLGLRYVQPAPPRTLTIAAGARGSAFDVDAQRYAKYLARYDITLKIVPSQGSIENLKLLSDPHSHVDIALVQSGIKPTSDTADLESLGSMFHQPLMIFYRAAKPISRLSELRGRSIAVGAQGSGTRYVAQALLGANGLSPADTRYLPLDGEAARDALLHHDADAVFLTGDSASTATIREMLHEQGVRLFDFARAEAYLRRFPWLHKIVIPPGGFDLGEDLPPSELTLLEPTVELLARPSLHPALSDLLIEAARSVHSRAGVFQNANEFPNSSAEDYPLSDAAGRYYKSGDRSFLYRVLPFWLASLINRLVVMVVPLAVVVIPALRYLPQLYSWRVESRIHHRYGELMALERESLEPGISDERRKALIERLRDIERSIITDKIPASHAEQLYLLRQHFNFVRWHLDPDSEESRRRPEVLIQRRASSQ
jgi:TRAP-type uncharacterized transport system substrate-binding protein